MLVKRSALLWCQRRSIFSSAPIPKPELAAAVAAEDPLADKFGRRHTYLRISLTERCNLRCKYCMPADGVALSKRDELLTTDELMRLAAVFVRQGVTKVRLTGGEPTVRKDIVQIIEGLKSLPNLETVAMTTNGLTLTRQLVALQKAGLDVINVSLDTLRPNRYELMARRKGFERAMAGIDLALQLGYNPVKINCVVMKDFNTDEILDFVNLTRDKSVDVRFIEYMPFSGNEWKSDTLISYKQMLDTIKKEYPDFRALPNHPNDTSKAWHVPGFKGQVGFITSMSEHFCGSCNRIRLTADGNLKVCLFGNAEVSLRDALRNNISEDDLVCLIGAAIRRKNKQHAAAPSKYRIASPSFTTLDSFEARPFANRSFARLYSTSSDDRPSSEAPAETRLSHVDATSGRARMVDVAHKASTARTARARATVNVGARVAQLIRDDQIAKGDVLTVAHVAGVLGAKRTPELIPMCHSVPLSSVALQLSVTDTRVVIVAEARCVAQTGVEMEALTAVCVAALTVYDMCKSASHAIRIEDIVLLKKEGGKSGKWEYNKDPIEHFYPVHV